MNIYVFSITMALLSGIWRMWFGGIVGSIPVLKERGLQCVAGIFFTAFLFTKALHPITTYVLSSPFVVTIPWINFTLTILSIKAFFIALAPALLIYVYMWAKGHGAFFDMIGLLPVSVATALRYTEAWGYALVEWLFNKGYIKTRYGNVYDTTLMFIRYYLPAVGIMILKMVLGAPILPTFLIGTILVVSAIGLYLLARVAYMKNHIEFRTATRYGEMALGFFIGFLILL